jgi:hypothetical protein
LSRDESATHLATTICNILFPKYGLGRHHKSPLELCFTFLGLCESDYESIKINFTDGLVTQFLFEWSCNDWAAVVSHKKRMKQGKSESEGARLALCRVQKRSAGASDSTVPTESGQPWQLKPLLLKMMSSRPNSKRMLNQMGLNLKMVTGTMSCRRVSLPLGK